MREKMEDVSLYVMSFFGRGRSDCSFVPKVERLHSVVAYSLYKVFGLS